MRLSHLLRTFNMKKHLTNILSWAFAGLILAYLFSKIPLDQVQGIFASLPLGRFVFFAVFYFVVMLFFDVAGLHWLLNRFCTPIKLAEILKLRGYSYLVMILNYAAGQGSLALYLKKKKQVPLFRALGAVMFFNFIDLFNLFTITFVALLLDNATKEDPIKTLLAPWITVLLVLTFLWIVFWRVLSAERFSHWQHKRPFCWFLKNDMAHFFREVTLSDYLKAWLGRLPTCFWAILGLYFSIISVNLLMPLAKVFLYGPLIGLVGSLPITPAGLGTTQILSVKLLAPWVSGPLVDRFDAAHVIVAITLLWGVANLVLKALMGLIALAFGSYRLTGNAD